MHQYSMPVFSSDDGLLLISSLKSLIFHNLFLQHWKEVMDELPPKSQQPLFSLQHTLRVII